MKHADLVLQVETAITALHRAIVTLLLWPMFESEFDQVGLTNLQMFIQSELEKRYLAREEALRMKVV